MSEISSVIVFPNVIAMFGGPTHAKTNGISIWVHFPDNVVRMPFSKALHLMNDGIALGELARAYACRKETKGA